MKRLRLALWFLTVMVFVPCLLFAESVECSRGTVFIDDSRADVLRKCSEPAWTESHQEEKVERLDSATKLKQFINVEEWTYNFGPSRFMRIITLENGKVTNIRTGDYGYIKDEKPPQSGFSDRILSIGESTGEVIAKWGEPTWRDTRQEELKEQLPDKTFRMITITIDEWTYNLGPSRFMRILTFKNGKLTDIKTGDYGYNAEQK
jgi:hypothetical protein